VKKGRVAFFLLGHFAETYAEASVARVLQRAVRWLGGELKEVDYRFDVFLSFSSHNETEAEKVAAAATAAGIDVFMSERDLESGDVWDEEVRQALVSSREMAVLVTPQSLQSEWVATEWGVAWALQNRITPILLRCDVGDLPDRLKQYEARDLHDIDLYVREVVSRRGSP
jgi:hypothetical protein